MSDQLTVVLAADKLDTGSALSALLVVCIVSAVAPIISRLIPDRPPQVVILLLGGILVGPSVLDLANPEPIQLLADLGLGFLFLLAGYEIEPKVLRGAIGRRALISWVCSLVLAAAVVTVLDEVGFIHAPVPIAIGLTTTALGTLLPILRDRDMLHGLFAESVIANGAVGELLPVLGIALALGAYDSWIEVVAIIAISALGWILTLIGRWTRGTPVERFIMGTAHGTAQTTLRWTMVVLVGLLLLTSKVGIDSVLGAFLAGIVLRRWIGAEGEISFDRKLDAVGYGLFIPVFFVVSGMSLDVKSIGNEPVRLLIFFGLLLVVRGLPVVFSFHGLMPTVERFQLALLCSTTLPLLVAVAELGQQDGRMLPENAAALVGAGMVSVAVCPFLAIRVLGAARWHSEVEPKSDAKLDADLEAEGPPQLGG